jgi:site-specific DNA recombinase
MIVQDQFGMLVLAQLLRDIAAGRVDCVVVYKVDRLSRSLVDFAKMMETLEQHQVAFVSVTQQFNLLSFAQFEREIISERTRDKIAAARRKGKWAGGMPLLGYDVEPRSSKLVVNAAEARRVRAIFTLYLQHEGLLPVLAELQRRGWRNKRWRTRKGSWRGGKPFTRNTLRQLLSNVTYRGQIRYRQEVHPGEHAAIVDASLWEQVQALLQDHRPRQGARLGNGALLLRSDTPTRVFERNGSPCSYLRSHASDPARLARGQARDASTWQKGGTIKGSRQRLGRQKGCQAR